MEDYNLGFEDARTSVLSLIDEWYRTYKTSLDLLPLPIALGFLKKAIIEADIESME